MRRRIEVAARKIDKVLARATFDQMGNDVRRHVTRCRFSADDDRPQARDLGIATGVIQFGLFKIVPLALGGAQAALSLVPAVLLLSGKRLSHEILLGTWSG
jgi:hypothetical protein